MTGLQQEPASNHEEADRCGQLEGVRWNDGREGPARPRAEQAGQDKGRGTASKDRSAAVGGAADRDDRQLGFVPEFSEEDRQVLQTLPV